VRSALSNVDGVEDLQFEGKTAKVVVSKDSEAAAVAALEKAGYDPKAD
jgi:copper chaperone CopZ